MVERQSAPLKNPVTSVAPSAKGTEHDGPMRDGFIAGNRYFPAYLFCACKFHKRYSPHYIELSFVNSISGILRSSSTAFLISVLVIEFHPKHSLLELPVVNVPMFLMLMPPEAE